MERFSFQFTVLALNGIVLVLNGLLVFTVQLFSMIISGKRQLKDKALSFVDS